MSTKICLFLLSIMSMAILTACAGKGDRTKQAHTQVAASVNPSSIQIEPERLPDTTPSFRLRGGEMSLLPPDQSHPITGARIPGMDNFDQDVVSYLRSNEIPGCAIAIAKHGKLIFAHGYGWADPKKREPVEPDSMFRIASISKSITAVAALKLCQDGKLSLGTKVLPYLGYMETDPNSTFDRRLNDITLQNLLECSAGWDRDISGDPCFQPFAKMAAEEYSRTLRPEADGIIRYWLRKPLDFPPGSRFSYSNLCYAIVGKAIAKASNESYEKYVQSHILEPMGIKNMRLGKTLVQYKGEVTYYPHVLETKTVSVYPNYTQEVPMCYGGDFALEAVGPEAGWISSMPALVKFACSVFGDDPQKQLLTGDTIAKMVARPKLNYWSGSSRYFALGWQVSGANEKGKIQISREGALSGSLAVLSRRLDGTTIAFATNTYPDNGPEFQNHLERMIWTAVDHNLRAGSIDLFTQYQ